jgi:hypothetical protein
MATDSSSPGEEAKRGDPKLPVAVMIRSDRLVPSTLACRDVDEFLALPLDAEQIIEVSRRLIADRMAGKWPRPVPLALDPDRVSRKSRVHH